MVHQFREQAAAVAAFKPRLLVQEAREEAEMVVLPQLAPMQLQILAVVAVVQAVAEMLATAAPASSS
jgi:hypothetical protein